MKEYVEKVQGQADETEIEPVEDIVTGKVHHHKATKANGRGDELQGGFQRIRNKSYSKVKNRDPEGSVRRNRRGRGDNSDKQNFNGSPSHYRRPLGFQVQLQPISPSILGPPAEMNSLSPLPQSISSVQPACIPIATDTLPIPSALVVVKNSQKTEPPPAPPIEGQPSKAEEESSQPFISSHIRVHKDGRWTVPEEGYLGFAGNARAMGTEALIGFTEQIGSFGSSWEWQRNHLDEALIVVPDIPGFPNLLREYEGVTQKQRQELLGQNLMDHGWHIIDTFTDIGVTDDPFGGEDYLTRCFVLERNGRFYQLAPGIYDITAPSEFDRWQSEGKLRDITDDVAQQEGHHLVQFFSSISPNNNPDAPITGNWVQFTPSGEKRSRSILNPNNPRFPGQEWVYTHGDSSQFTIIPVNSDSQTGEWVLWKSRKDSLGLYLHARYGATLSEDGAIICSPETRKALEKQTNIPGTDERRSQIEQLNEAFGRDLQFAEQTAALAPETIPPVQELPAELEQQARTQSDVAKPETKLESKAATASLNDSDAMAALANETIIPATPPHDARPAVANEDELRPDSKLVTPTPNEIMYSPSARVRIPQNKLPPNYRGNRDFSLEDETSTEVENRLKERILKDNGWTRRDIYSVDVVAHDPILGDVPAIQFTWVIERGGKIYELKHQANAYPLDAPKNLDTYINNDQAVDITEYVKAFDVQFWPYRKKDDPDAPVSWHRFRPDGKTIDSKVLPDKEHYQKGAGLWVTTYGGENRNDWTIFKGGYLPDEVAGLWVIRTNPQENRAQNIDRYLNARFGESVKLNLEAKTLVIDKKILETSLFGLHDPKGESKETQLDVLEKLLEVQFTITDTEGNIIIRSTDNEGRTTYSISSEHVLPSTTQPVETVLPDTSAVIGRITRAITGKFGAPIPPDVVLGRELQEFHATLDVGQNRIIAPSGQHPIIKQILTAVSSARDKKGDQLIRPDQFTLATPEEVAAERKQEAVAPQEATLPAQTVPAIEELPVSDPVAELQEFLNEFQPSQASPGFKFFEADSRRVITAVTNFFPGIIYSRIGQNGILTVPSQRVQEQLTPLLDQLQKALGDKTLTIKVKK